MNKPLEVLKQREAVVCDYFDYYNDHDIYDIPSDLKRAYSKAVSCIEDELEVKLFQFQKEMIFNIMCSRKGVKRIDL
jgi:predicted transcriptional regulator